MAGRQIKTSTPQLKKNRESPATEFKFRSSLIILELKFILFINVLSKLQLLELVDLLLTRGKANIKYSKIRLKIERSKKKSKKNKIKQDH